MGLHIYQQTTTISPDCQPPTREYLTNCDNTILNFDLNPKTHPSLFIQSTHNLLRTQNIEPVATDRGNSTDTNAHHHRL
ncbi:hypothetical protein O181_071709 [Austropuccinia psidii MF-1]|uniref:Uncharacterized protein n=1 Tax=Austropuccinia psidii MF-1 TaxID=1389203 RepID=A0A9Q3F3R1_9BASI|nr:hypothetical protein [Austropuccinia psidii MF-1]